MLLLPTRPLLKLATAHRYRSELSGTSSSAPLATASAACPTNARCDLSLRARAAPESTRLLVFLRLSHPSLRTKQPRPGSPARYSDHIMPRILDYYTVEMPHGSQFRSPLTDLATLAVGSQGQWHDRETTQYMYTVVARAKAWYDWALGWLVGNFAQPLRGTTQQQHRDMRQAVWKWLKVKYLTLRAARWQGLATIDVLDQVVCSVSRCASCSALPDHISCFQLEINITMVVVHVAQSVSRDRESFGGRSLTRRRCAGRHRSALAGAGLMACSTCFSGDCVGVAPSRVVLARGRAGEQSGHRLDLVRAGQCPNRGAASSRSTQGTPEPASSDCTRRRMVTAPLRARPSRRWRESSHGTRG